MTLSLTQWWKVSSCSPSGSWWWRGWYHLISPASEAFVQLVLLPPQGSQNAFEQLSCPFFALWAKATNAAPRFLTLFLWGRSCWQSLGKKEKEKDRNCERRHHCRESSKKKKRSHYLPCYFVLRESSSNLSTTDVAFVLQDLSKLCQSGQILHALSTSYTIIKLLDPPQQTNVLVLHLLLIVQSALYHEQHISAESI